MQKLSQHSDRLLFVCYYPGAGGERLSVLISQLRACEALQSYFTEQSRTVITNDLFEKTFLTPVGPFDRLRERAQAITIDWSKLEKVHVVPSHWDIQYLEPLFPSSRFIRIISPADLDLLVLNTDRKVMQGRFNSLLELKGYCLMYVTETTFRDLLKEKKLRMSMTIGQVHAVLEPFITSDMRETFFCHDGTNLYRDEIIKTNVLNIPYQECDRYISEIEHFITQT